MALNFLKSCTLQQIAFIIVAITVVILFYHTLINSDVQTEILVKQDRNLNATLKNQNITLENQDFIINNTKVTIQNQILILEALREIRNATASNPQTTLQEQRESFGNVEEIQEDHKMIIELLTNKSTGR